VKRAAWLVTLVTLFVATRALAEASPVTHVFALPNDQTRNSALFRLAPIDMVVGAAPGTVHPRGTVFVIESELGKTSATIAEWDIASGKRLRSADLPVLATNWVTHFVRAGDHFHLVGLPEAVGMPMIYVRLNLGFGVEEVRSLGNGENACIATDGSLVAIVWSEILDSDLLWHRTYLLTMDAQGARVGSAVIVPQAAHQVNDMFVEPLAVMGGKVFLLAWQAQQTLLDPKPLLWRLSADGQVEAEVRFDDPPSSGSLTPAAGRLLMVSDFCKATLWSPELVPIADLKKPPYRDPTGYSRCPSFTVGADAKGRLVSAHGDVLSPDLQVQAHFALAPNGVQAARALWVGSEPALLEADYYGRAWITWAEGVPSPTP
jgi:hypothetical protein